MSDTVEGVCEKCGGGVSMHEEGFVVCNGCGVSTAVCSCGRDSTPSWDPPDRENVV